MSSVYAELRRLNPVIAGEDSGTVLCEFRNSVSVLFDGNRLVDHEAEDTRLTMGEMLIEGAAGVLRLNGQGRIFFRKCGEQENEHEYAWESCGFAGDCVFSCQSHVVSHLLNGTQLRPLNYSGTSNLIHPHASANFMWYVNAVLVVADCWQNCNFRPAIMVTNSVPVLLTVVFIFNRRDYFLSSHRICFFIHPVLPLLFYLNLLL